jgi:hypothetical protein
MKDHAAALAGLEDLTATTGPAPAKIAALPPNPAHVVKSLPSAPGTDCAPARG